MADQLEFILNLRLRASEFARGLRDSATHVRGFGDDVRRSIGGASVQVERFNRITARTAGSTARSVRALGRELNGFSAITGGVAALGGFSALKSTLNTQLEFERRLFFLRQNAGLSTLQADQLRADALGAARGSLQLPSSILSGQAAYAAAGWNFDRIRTATAEAARAATAMETTVENIARLDVDVLDKFGIAPERLDRAHETMYFHGRAGRFESPAMTALAPVYLNAAKAVGIGGERGLNFVGALTQSIMKQAPATEPGVVATLIQQGLGHITSPHYLKGLRRAGVDVLKYMPGGQFTGEGGVDGLLGLAREMRAKGLQDPIKLSAAGVADQEARKFWLQLMQDADVIPAQMRAAQGSNDIRRVVLEAKESNFGKVLTGEIAAEQLKLSPDASAVATLTGSATQWAADNPGSAAVAGAAGVLGGRWAWLKGLPRLGEWLSGLGLKPEPVAAARAAGATTVAQGSPWTLARAGGVMRGGLVGAPIALGTGYLGDALGEWLIEQTPDDWKAPEFRKRAPGARGEPPSDVQIDGVIRIELDAQGIPRVTRARSNSNIDFDFSAGPIALGAGQ